MSLVPMQEYFRGLIRVQAISGEALRAEVLFPTDLQGPPETAHGGGVAAMLLETIRLYREGNEPSASRQPLQIAVRLHREVPLQTWLSLEASPNGRGWRSRLLREERLLAEAEVCFLEQWLSPPAGEIRRRWEESQEGRHTLPGYEFCLACGRRNPRGAQVRFQYTDSFVWTNLAPQGHFRYQDGTLFSGYLCIVLDEIGWWMGALRQGECGVSTRVTIAFEEPLPFGTSLLLLGERAAVLPLDTKGRVWQTRALILAPEWRVVARADVEFAGSRAFTKVMLPKFLPEEDPDALFRVFPRYGPPPANPSTE